jgi:hypothetical protein
MRFQVLTAENVKMKIFPVVAQCILVETDRRFRRAASIIMVVFYQSKRRNVPEDSHLQWLSVIQYVFVQECHFYNIFRLCSWYVITVYDIVKHLAKLSGTGRGLAGVCEGRWSILRKEFQKNCVQALIRLFCLLIQGINFSDKNMELQNL